MDFRTRTSRPSGATTTRARCFARTVCSNATTTRTLPFNSTAAPCSSRLSMPQTVLFAPCPPHKAQCCLPALSQCTARVHRRPILPHPLRRRRLPSTCRVLWTDMVDALPRSPLSRLQMALPSPSNIFAQECSRGAARACNTWFVSTTTRWFPWYLYRVRQAQAQLL